MNYYFFAKSKNLSGKDSLFSSSFSNKPASSAVSVASKKGIIKLNVPTNAPKKTNKNALTLIIRNMLDYNIKNCLDKSTVIIHFYSNNPKNILEITKPLQ